MSALLSAAEFISSVDSTESTGAGSAGAGHGEYPLHDAFHRLPEVRDDGHCLQYQRRDGGGYPGVSHVRASDDAVSAQAAQ